MGGDYLLIVVLSACAPSTAPNTRTPTATKTATRTPEPKSGCIRWDKVRKSDQGKEVCVSGDVIFGLSGEDGNGNIAFWIVGFSDTGTLQIDDDGTVFIEHGKIAKC